MSISITPFPKYNIRIHIEECLPSDAKDPGATPRSTSVEIKADPDQFVPLDELVKALTDGVNDIIEWLSEDILEEEVLSDDQTHLESESTEL